MVEDQRVGEESAMADSPLDVQQAQCRTDGETENTRARLESQQGAQ